MRLIKIFGSIILVLGLVYFLAENDSRVDVDLIFAEYRDDPKTDKDERASVSMIMLGALTVGIFIGYLSAVFSVLSAKADIRNLQSKNRRLTEELNDLRNVAIDEGIYDTEGGDY
tara:strand:- start:4813 stop:5157 length:345 start_codon:yes stop_codon:yes gene_type:complete